MGNDADVMCKVPFSIMFSYSFTKRIHRLQAPTSTKKKGQLTSSLPGDYNF